MTNPAVTEALDILSKHHDLGYDCSEWQMCDALATIRAALDHAAEVEARLEAMVGAAGAVVGCRGAGVGTRSLWMDIQALENALKAAKSEEAS
jgi:hypothetical protein